MNYYDFKKVHQEKLRKDDVKNVETMFKDEDHKESTSKAKGKKKEVRLCAEGLKELTKRRKK
jgi:hypothetical protein